MKRRELLRWGGLSVVALATSACAGIPTIPKNPVPTAEDALGWIRLTPRGEWLLVLPRVEMGQNIATALRHVAAFELGIEEEALRVVHARTDQIARTKITAGSDSVREAAPPLARAAWVLRQEVLRRAAAQLGLSTQGLQLNATAVLAPSGAAVALADLAREPMALQAQDTAVAQLRWSQATQVSVRAPVRAAVEHADIGLGKALYAADVRLPGMLFVCVLRPPFADQALAVTPLLGLDEAAVRAVPGFHSIVRHPALAGPALVATRMGALLRMRAVAQARWAAPPAAQQLDVMQAVDVDRQLPLPVAEGSDHFIELRLDVPASAHASMEPRCAVAQPVAGGGVQVWCGSQSPFFVRDGVAKTTGLPLAQVQVQAMRVGGSFGGKTFVTVESEAAVLALALGQAVKVQWSREDEFLGSAHRPPSSHHLRATLQAGRIQRWEHHLSSAHVLFTNAVLPPWAQQLTDLVGDKGPRRGHQPLYALGRTRLPVATRRLGIYTGPWRGLGAGPNVMAIEMAIDLAAQAAKADALDFRLAHLANAPATEHGDPSRLAECFVQLKRLRQTAAPAQGAPDSTWLVAEGSAGGCYKGMAYSAATARVALQLGPDQRLRSAKVLDIWCTHDCGQMVDEDGVLAQVEGNLVWCVGMVLMEQLSTTAGVVDQRSLAQYPMPRLSDMPRLHLALLRNAHASGGAGETAMVSGAGAIANALRRGLQAAGLPMPSSLPVRGSA